MDVIGRRQMGIGFGSVVLHLAATILLGNVVVVAQDRSPSKASSHSQEEVQRSSEPKIYPSPAAASNPTTAAHANDARAEQVPAAGQGAESYTLRVYEIQELIDKLGPQFESTKDAEQHLVGALALSDDDPLQRDLSIRVDGDDLHLGGKDPRALVLAGKLYVFDHPSVHERVQKQIDRWRTHGLELIRVETSLMLVPADKWNQVEVAWKPARRLLDLAAGSKGNHSADSDFLDRPAKLPPAVVTAASPSVVSPRGVTSRTSGVPTGDFNPIRQVSATTIIHDSSSVMFTIVQSDPSGEIMERIPGCTILSRPKMITISGQSATVEILQQTPMTVGYKTPTNGNGQPGVVEPVVQQVEVGASMKLRPILVDGLYVHLDFDLRITRIHDLDPIQSSDPEAPPQSVQTLATSTIQSMLNIPVGAVLAIGGTTVEQNGKSYRLLCAVRCDQLDNNQPTAP